MASKKRQRRRMPSSTHNVDLMSSECRRKDQSLAVFMRSEVDEESAIRYCEFVEDEG